MLISDQGKQDSDNQYEIPSEREICPEPIPFEISKECIEYDIMNVKNELKQLMSAAGEKELMVPNQKDMNIKNYIKKYTKKNVGNASSTTLEDPKGMVILLKLLIEYSLICLLDSFQHELAVVKSFLKKLESQHNSNEKKHL